MWERSNDLSEFTAMINACFDEVHESDTRYFMGKDHTEIAVGEVTDCTMDEANFIDRNFLEMEFKKALMKFISEGFMGHIFYGTLEYITPYNCTKRYICWRCYPEYKQVYDTEKHRVKHSFYARLQVGEIT